MTMAKRDLPRMSWSFLVFVTGLIFVTLSSAEDAMTICRRIQSNVLKIQTMGLVGDKLIVLTAEGHLFYLPKANLRGAGTSSPTLIINQVPVRANRVFGVELDYSIRHGYIYFLLADGENELLMTLQVESKEVRLLAFLLDWKKTRKGQKSDWTEKRSKPNVSDFKPHFMVNEDNTNCAQAITTFHIHRPELKGFFPIRSTPTQEICLNGDSLKVEWFAMEFDPFIIPSDELSTGPQILTGFQVQESKNGKATEFELNTHGLLSYKTAQMKTPNNCQLSHFIQCGPNFTDATSRWEPAQVNRSSNVTHKQTRISGWTIVTVILVGLSICLVIMILLLKKKQAKKPNRKNKHFNLNSSASSVIGSSNVGSSNVSSGGSSDCTSSCVSSGASSTLSSAFSSSNASSGASLGINLGSSASSAIESSKVNSSNVSLDGSSAQPSSNTSSGMSSALNSSSSSNVHGSSPASKSSKLQSFINRVMSAFKRNQKKNAELRSKAKKTKENKMKKNDGSKK